MNLKQLTVVETAKTWLKTPYHHAARVKGAGVDCAQIVLAVFVEAGLIDEFDPGEYPPDWMLHRSEERYLLHVTERAERVESPQPGDVALYLVGRCYAHGAIVVDWPLIIHASSRDRMVCLADGMQGWLAGRDVQFWRARGMDA